MLITESQVDPNYLMTLINWVYQSFTTTNIGQITTQPAINNSVNPQFIKSKYICAFSTNFDISYYPLCKYTINAISQKLIFILIS